MKKILLFIAPVILIMLAFRPIKSITVSGTVSDETGSPLPGVSIQVKGSRTGVSTSSSGSYKIVVPNSNDVLVFSGVDLETKEEKIAGRTKINVTLKRIVVVGTEVVVTAIGQNRQPKVLGYATSKISPSYLSQGVPVRGDMNSYYYPDKDESREEFDREGYDHITENKFLKVSDK